MAYKPSSRGGVFVGVGGGTTTFALLDEITASGISHNPPDTPAQDASMSLYAKAVVQQAQGGTAGTATYSFEPSDAMAAWQDLQSLQGRADIRVFREEQGIIRTVLASGTPRIAIASTGVGTLTVLGDSDPEDDWDAGQLIVSGDVAYAIERIMSSSTVQLSRVGSVTGNVVTKDDTAIGTVAAAAFSVVEYATRRQFSATLNSLSPSGSATDRTAEVVVQLRGFEVESYLTADAARTIALPSA